MSPLQKLMVLSHRTVSISTFMSIFTLQGQWRVGVYPGDALISRARSIAATEWLNQDASIEGDVAVMTDDDFAFTSAEINALLPLCRETRGIVAGVTPLRSGNYTAIVALDESMEEPWTDRSSPPLQIRWAGGLIAYHRTVFERLAETLPLLHEDDSMCPAFYPFFMPMVYEHENGRKSYLSEDYACHERARQLGIPVWVQPACQVGHLANVLVTPNKMHQVRELHQVK